MSESFDAYIEDNIDSACGLLASYCMDVLLGDIDQQHRAILFGNYVIALSIQEDCNSSQKDKNSLKRSFIDGLTKQQIHYLPTIASCVHYLDTRSNSSIIFSLRYLWSEKEEFGLKKRTFNGELKSTYLEKQQFIRFVLSTEWRNELFPDALT